MQFIGTRLPVVIVGVSAWCMVLKILDHAIVRMSKKFKLINAVIAAYSHEIPVVAICRALRLLKVLPARYVCGLLGRRDFPFPMFPTSKVNNEFSIGNFCKKTPSKLPKEFAKIGIMEEKNVSVLPVVLCPLSRYSRY